MKDYQQRVVEEKTELDVKLKALRKYRSSDVFQDLSRKENDQLNYQYSLMVDYSGVLGERIAAFKSTD